VRSLALLLLAAVALAGCGGGDEQAADTAAAPTSGVKELGNVLDLRADFEADAGKPRVIVLFSPT
jgi:ABC-type glycerol-3-phosphate transport system substrate-binding protein